jgi:hypothetical protein
MENTRPAKVAAVLTNRIAVNDFLGVLDTNTAAQGRVFGIGVGAVVILLVLACVGGMIAVVVCKRLTRADHTLRKIEDYIEASEAALQATLLVQQERAKLTLESGRISRLLEELEARRAEQLAAANDIELQKEQLTHAKADLLEQTAQFAGRRKVHDAISIAQSNAVAEREVYMESTIKAVRSVFLEHYGTPGNLKEEAPIRALDNILQRQGFYFRQDAELDE